MNWINISEHKRESCHTLLDFYWCVQNSVNPVKEIYWSAGLNFWFGISIKLYQIVVIVEFELLMKK